MRLPWKIMVDEGASWYAAYSVRDARLSEGGWSWRWVVGLLVIRPKSRDVSVLLLVMMSSLSWWRSVQVLFA